MLFEALQFAINRTLTVVEPTNDWAISRRQKQYMSVLTLQLTDEKKSRGSGGIVWR